MHSSAEEVRTKGVPMAAQRMVSLTIPSLGCMPLQRHALRLLSLNPLRCLGLKQRSREDYAGADAPNVHTSWGIGPIRQRSLTNPRNKESPHKSNRQTLGNQWRPMSDVRRQPGKMHTWNGLRYMPGKWTVGASDGALAKTSFLNSGDLRAPRLRKAALGPDGRHFTADRNAEPRCIAAPATWMPTTSVCEGGRPMSRLPDMVERKPQLTVRAFITSPSGREKHTKRYAPEGPKYTETRPPNTTPTL